MKDDNVYLKYFLYLFRNKITEKESLVTILKAALNVMRPYIFGVLTLHN